MIFLLQRVKSASVVVLEQEVAKIGQGLLILVGLEKTDTPEIGIKMRDKTLTYRIFSDENGKMNRNIQEIDGEILLVSQFTLVANTNKGRRPSFDSAMAPNEANALFSTLVSDFKVLFPRVQTGVFGAEMAVSLINDGPVTFYFSS